MLGPHQHKSCFFTVGKATDNERMVVDGKTQERKGEAQQVKGKVKGALGDDV